MPNNLPHCSSVITVESLLIVDKVDVEGSEFHSHRWTQHMTLLFQSPLPTRQHCSSLMSVGVFILGYQILKF